MNGSEDIAAMIERITGEVVALLTTYGLDVLGAVVMLIVGVWLAGRVGAGVSKGLNKTKRVDATLVTFFGSVAKYLVLAITIIAVLNQFGVETTSLVAVLGAAGLAIGLALQGTLSNVAAGVMLLIFRPFKVGDFVEVAGHAGTVKELNLFVTVMATGDNVRIIVPNAQIWGGSLKNFSANPTRRVDFTFGIAYDADIDKAMALIRSVVDADERVHKDPEPFIVVGNLGESSVDLIVRVWTNSGDYWGVKFDVTKTVKQRMDAEGVGIPFPSRTLYMVNKG